MIDLSPKSRPLRNGGATVTCAVRRALGVCAGCKATEGVLRSAARGTVEIAEFIVRSASSRAQRAESRRVAINAGYVFFGFDVRATGSWAVSWCSIGGISLLPEAEVSDGAAVECLQVAALAWGTFGIRNTGLTEPHRLNGGRG
jgi:hypothetical protein